MIIDLGLVYSSVARKADPAGLRALWPRPASGASVGVLCCGAINIICKIEESVDDHKWIEWHHRGQEKKMRRYWSA